MVPNILWLTNHLSDELKCPFFNVNNINYMKVDMKLDVLQMYLLLLAILAIHPLLLLYLHYYIHSVELLSN